MTGYDVIIVGGRVAGASTALLLARAGLRVAVVERSARGSDTVSTHGLMRAGVLQLHRWGLLDAMTATGAPPIRSTVFHYPDSDPVHITIRPSHGVPALYAPRRNVFDELLLDAAARAGAELHREVAVRGLLRESGRVVGVRVASRTGPERMLRGALTVGADGFASLVAREVGAETLRRGRHAGAVLYGYFDVPAAGYEWAYADGAAAGLIPTHAGETCVFAGTTPTAMRALRPLGRDAAFAALLHRASPALAHRVREAGAAHGRLHSWGGIPGWIREPAGPGWALVGDAGCFKDPISSHGMTQALRDADLLATAIVETLSGRLPESVAMGEYRMLRDRVSRVLFETADRIAAYDWTPDLLRRLLRTHAAALSDEVDQLAALPMRLAAESGPVPTAGLPYAG